MNKNTLKSMGALLTGFLAVIILSLGTDIVLHATGVFPPLGQPMVDALFLLATHCLRRRGELHRGAARARSAHDARPGAWRRGPCREYFGRRGDVEQGTGLRAPLVPPRTHRAGDAVRLGGRQAPWDAVARTR